MEDPLDPFAEMRFCLPGQNMVFDADRQKIRVFRPDLCALQESFEQRAFFGKFKEQRFAAGEGSCRFSLCNRYE